VCSLVIGARLKYPQERPLPHNLTMTLLGAGLLWFGWFGFNGGSALASNGQAGAALAASQVAAAAAALSWMVAEWLHRGKPTALGLASGIVAGLVAVTPASGYVTPLGALAIGLIAGAVCYVAVCLKPFCKYDDSLDAFGVHGVGGFLGAILTGIFASAVYIRAGAGPTAATGILDQGLGAQVLVQFITCMVAVVFAFVVTYVLVLAIDRTWGFCLDDRGENEGLDRSQHGEVGFDLGPTLDLVRERSPQEPRHADVPPNGYKRFHVVVEGIKPQELKDIWSDLCQAGPKPVKPEFKAIYPFVTTVQGNRFTFRGGDPNAMRDNLTRLFELMLRGQPVRGRIEQ
jgi:Amt family ammonium transporter